MTPTKIILMRHAEPEPHVPEADGSYLRTLPDHERPLTALGVAQAAEAGQIVRGLAGGQPVRAYVSPYRRTRATLAGMDLGDVIERTYEEPRLREMQFTCFADPATTGREGIDPARTDHFFYRSGNGESPADVYDRVCSFTETLYRHLSEPGCPTTALIVAHCITVQLLTMRLLHRPVEYLSGIECPDFASIRTFTRDDRGWQVDVELPAR